MVDFFRSCFRFFILFLGYNFILITGTAFGFGLLIIFDSFQSLFNLYEYLQFILIFIHNNWVLCLIVFIIIYILGFVFYLYKFACIFIKQNPDIIKELKGG